MAIFSIWEGDGITLKRGSGPPRFADGRLHVEDPLEVKVLEFQAGSWNEACQRQNDHYGWGYYPPHDGWEEILDHEWNDEQTNLNRTND
jgi:hypothetical protein